MKKLGFLLLASTLLLAGCYGGGKSGNETSSEPAAVKQEISVSLSGELSTLDSAQYTDVNSSDMIGQLYQVPLHYKRLQ